MGGRMINCCLKYKLFVGRGHDPADHLGQLSGKNASKMCKLPEIQYSSVSLRCGGVMTPPYDSVYFNSLNNNLAWQLGYVGNGGSEGLAGGYAGRTSAGQQPTAEIGFTGWRI